MGDLMADVAGRFAKNTACHEMTILHDDGLYRHLRFQRVVVITYIAECQQCTPVLPQPFSGYRERDAWRAAHVDATGHQVRPRVEETPPSAPGLGKKTSNYWFDLVTWPGSLAIRGDCGDYLFARDTDMFGFFRGARVNPGYWAEKCKGGKTSSYSEDLFRRTVMDAAYEAEEDWPGLTAAVEKQIFGDPGEWNTEHEDGAREALRDFEFGTSYMATCSCGDGTPSLAYGAAENWASAHRARKDRAVHLPVITRADGFTFTDAWEWDLRDHDWQFLWCCHAIRKGIAMYDKQKQEALSNA